MLKNTISILLLFILTLTSCNTFLQVEKRHYRNGFYIQHTNSHTRTFSADAISEKSVANFSIVKSDSASMVKPTSLFRKIEVVRKKSVNQFRKKINQVETKSKSLILEKEIKKAKEPGEPDEYKHDIGVSMLFGIIAVLAVIIGLIVIEFSFFGLVPILIGICLAVIGRDFARKALQFGIKKRKGHEATDADLIAKRKKAKGTYILNLIAILIVLLYLLIRFGIVAAGSAIGITLLICGLCLILFFMFRLGVFRDLKG